MVHPSLSRVATPAGEGETPVACRGRALPRRPPGLGGYYTDAYADWGALLSSFAARQADAARQAEESDIGTSKIKTRDRATPYEAVFLKSLEKKVRRPNRGCRFCCNLLRKHAGSWHSAAAPGGGSSVRMRGSESRI